MKVIVVFVIAAVCLHIDATPVKHERCHDGDTPLSDNGFEKPGDCNNFYQCSNGYLHIMPCPTNLAFNPVTGNCDYPHNVEGCDKDEKAEEPEEPIGDEACIVDGQAISRGPRAIPENCTSFQECNSGVESIRSCPDGLYFNSDSLVCDWPRNVPDCNKPEPPNNLVICEHSRTTVGCPDNKVVQIVDAFYGRDDDQTCPGAVYTTDCKATTSVNSIPRECNNKASCDLYASNTVYGDPCVGTFKFIKVLFNCVSPNNDGLQ